MTDPHPFPLPRLSKAVIESRTKKLQAMPDEEREGRVWKPGMDYQRRFMGMMIAFGRLPRNTYWKAKDK